MCSIRLRGSKIFLLKKKANTNRSNNKKGKKLIFSSHVVDVGLEGDGDGRGAFLISAWLPHRHIALAG